METNLEIRELIELHGEWTASSDELVSSCLSHVLAVESSSALMISLSSWLLLLWFRSFFITSE